MRAYKYNGIVYRSIMDCYKDLSPDMTYIMFYKRCIACMDNGKDPLTLDLVSRAGKIFSYNGVNYTSLGDFFTKYNIPKSKGYAIYRATGDATETLNHNYYDSKGRLYD